MVRCLLQRSDSRELDRGTPLGCERDGRKGREPECEGDSEVECWGESTGETGTGCGCGVQSESPDQGDALQWVREDEIG